MADVFYPACTVNFRLRFDEAFHVVDLGTPASVQALVHQQPLQLSGLTLATVSQNIATLASQTRQGQRPLVMAGKKDTLSHVLSVVPRQASVEMLGYREAWKWSLSLRFRDFPFDPRVLRAVGVEVHMGTVPADRFALGISGPPQTGAHAVLSQLSPVMLSTRDAAGNMNLETLQVIGVMDDMEVEHGETGSEVKLSGRDLRGIFMDSPLSPRMVAKLDLKAPIDDVVRQILAKHPMGERFVVEVDPTEWVQGSVPSPAVAGDLTRVRLGVDGATPETAPPGDNNKLNFWSLITQYCFLVGAIPFFDGPTLRLRPARNIFDLVNRAGSDPRIKTPFAGGLPRVVGQDQFNLRRVVYGRNTKRLSFDRKFAGVTVPVIECVSVDTSSTKRGAGKLITARWPNKVARIDDSFLPLPGHEKVVAKTESKPGSALHTKVSPSGEQVQEDIVRIPVPGIRSADRLREIAKDLYEEIGRGEMGGSFETRNMASYGGGNSDPDLLRLRPGDAVEFLVDASSLNTNTPPIAELVDHERRSFAEEVAAVTDRIGDPNLARVLVASARGNVRELLRFFRTNNVRFNWDVSSGITVSSDFQNYFVARFDVTPKKPPAPRSVPKKTVVAKRTEPVKVENERNDAEDTQQLDSGAQRALDILDKIKFKDEG